MHVPEENLPKYRRLAELAHLISRMGDMASNLQEYTDANTLWAMGGKYKRMANQLRVPGKDEDAQEDEAGQAHRDM
jgi:hypothetical protein